MVSLCAVKILQDLLARPIPSDILLELSCEGQLCVGMSPQNTSERESEAKEAEVTETTLETMCAVACAMRPRLREVAFPSFPKYPLRYRDGGQADEGGGIPMQMPQI